MVSLYPATRLPSTSLQLLIFLVVLSPCHSARNGSHPDPLSTALLCVAPSTYPLLTQSSVRSGEPHLLKPYTAGNFSWYLVRGDVPSASQVLPGIDPGLVDAGEGSVWFDRFRPGDAGIYAAVCRESGLLGECFNVSVYEPDPASCFLPEPVFVGRPAFIGQSHYIYCPQVDDFLSDGGDGLISLTWLKECAPLLRAEQVDKQLLIPKVVVGDEGNYTCVVKFTRFNRTYSLSRTRRIEIVVPSNAKPPIVLNPDKNITMEVQFGQRVMLQCVAFFGYDVSQTPNLYWTINSKFVETLYNDTEVREHPISVLSEAYGERRVSRPLELSSVSLPLLGNEYTCNALNSYGFGRGLVSLVLKVPPKTYTAVVSGSLVAGFAVAVAVAALVYVRRIDLVLLYRDHCASPTAPDGKEFDAYVSFCSECPSPGEEEFALRTLPRVLEGEFGYRLCLPDRDILPGGAVVDEIISAIDRSRRVIAVLTPAYTASYPPTTTTTTTSPPPTTSAFSHCELDAALHSMMTGGSTRLLLVRFLPLGGKSGKKKNHADVTNPGLRRALAVLPVIRWEPEAAADSSARFWKRLRYAMPPRRKNGGDGTWWWWTNTRSWWRTTRWWNGRRRRSPDSGSSNGAVAADATAAAVNGSARGIEAAYSDVTIEMKEAVLGESKPNGTDPHGAFTAIPNAATTTTIITTTTSSNRNLSDAADERQRFLLTESPEMRRDLDHNREHRNV